MLRQALCRARREWRSLDREWLRHRTPPACGSAGQVPGLQALQFAVRSALPSCSIFAQLCSRTLKHGYLQFGAMFIEPKHVETSVGGPGLHVPVVRAVPLIERFEKVDLMPIGMKSLGHSIPRWLAGCSVLIVRPLAWGNSRCRPYTKRYEGRLTSVYCPLSGFWFPSLPGSSIWVK